ncbi:MAG: type IX secretion system sortase PorU [Candidatus Eisenbacteria bacterium]
MRTRGALPLLAGLLLLAAVVPPWVPGAPELVGDGEEGISYRFVLPALVPQPVGGERVMLRARGLSMLSEEGAPAVPVQEILVALPPGASASVEVSDLVIERTSEYRVAPFPRMDREENAHFEVGERYSGRLFPEEWAEVSPPARLRDQRVATVRVNPVRHDFRSGATEILRSAIIRVRFSGARKRAGEAPPPDAFEPVYREALANYRSGIAWRERAVSARKAPAGDSFASSPNWVKVTVSERGLHAISYEDFVEAGHLNPRASIGDPRALRMYAGSGLPLPEKETADRPEWMRQLAIRVAGEEDGSFDAGDRIEFFALPASGWRGEYDPDAPEYYDHLEHPYSWTNAYWITWGGAFDEGPKRMSRVSAGPEAAPGAVTLATFPDRVHGEENNIKDLTRFGEDGWFWDKYSPTENNKSFFVQVLDADTSRDGNVRIRFFHYADALGSCGTERARISVNDVPSTLQEWSSCALDDGALQPFDYDSTAHWVKNGFNRFDITVAFRQKVYLCWIEMGFERFFRARSGELHFRLEEPGAYRIPITRLTPGAARVFEVTDPFDVKELGGLSSAGDSLLLHAALPAPATFHAVADTAWKTPVSVESVVPANLRDGAGVAEYLVICYDEFIGAVSELVAHRSADYSTRVVPLSAVYNEFSWGVRDAVAVRDFLLHAYHEWPVERRPVFVLLVGDATSDFKGHLDSALETLLPTFFRVDRGGSDTNTYATDDFFAYLDPGEGTGDRLPDLAVGRLPVNTIGEARTILEKTVEYEADPEYGPWRNRLLFLADDEVKKDKYDCAFLLTHTQDTESVANSVPEYFDKIKVYMVEYPLTSAGLKPLAKNSYIGWIKEGFLLSNYLGHGGVDKMADEELLVLAEVSPQIMSNGKRLHVFCAFSCSIGSWDLLDRNSMGETLLKMAGGGAVASFSSDAPAFSGVSLALDTTFVAKLFPENHGVLPLGLAAQAAKSVGGTLSGRKINDEKYTVLGDPALLVGVPELGVRFQGGGVTAFTRGRVDTLYGEVVDTTGALVASFDGTAEVSIWGMADTLGYSFLDTACYGQPNNPKKQTATYSMLGPTFFHGTADVRDGRFEAPFFVPRDTRVGSFGRASVYILSSGGALDGSGGDDSVRVIAEPPGTVWNDTLGPEVSFTVNGHPVRDGTSFTKNSVFRLELEDESGINLQQNDNFYSLHIVFDRGRPIDLTSLFKYDRNSFRKGGLSFRLSDFPDVFVLEGRHDLALRASDNLNNRAEEDYSIFVVDAASELAFRAPVLNYPNPFDPDRDGTTQIAVDLTRSAQVTIQILTHTGKRIREIETSTAETGLSVRFDWDGRDADGDLVANGVYLVRAVAQAEDGSQKTESIGKVAVLRGVR